MVYLLKIALILALFSVSKIVISKIVVQKLKKEIFGYIRLTEVDNIFIKNKRLIKIIALFLMITYISLISGYSLFFSIIIGVLSLGIVYGAKSIKQKVLKKQVLNDLLNVSECMRVQLSSQIPLGSALRNIPELCVNKELKGLLTNLYLEYELSKFVIIDSTKALQNKFDYPEIRIFISSLNQQVQGTSAIEAFDNLISILREKYIDFLEDATKSKIAIMTIGVFWIVLNIGIIGVYPITIEALNAINIMLK